MADKILLVGAEEVMRAAMSMATAAESIRQSSADMRESNEAHIQALRQLYEQHHAWVSEWLLRFESIMHGSEV